MSKIHTEEQFESAIEAHLLANGYSALPKDGYDIERAFFPTQVIGFIRETQAEELKRIETMLGDKTDETLLKDLNFWLNSQGMLPVLRNGFKCHGRTFRVCFFKPAHGMNPTLESQYGANRLSVTRQLRYSSKNSNELDLVLSINGLPVITAELKNPMTGQTVENAIRQYKKDRDHRELLFDFKKRALVHFAMDTELAYMTTRLAGSATFFLPFNQGDEGGAGNPPNAGGYRTSYVWEQVWQRESLLDIFARFLHLQVEDKRTEDDKLIKKETMIFPRYHQLSAVRELVAASKIEGAGNNYLVEHSAGSGKSNTIGWLAHRLASLHTDADEKVFDSVIVITDRRVLDKQLQDTIYQFDHRQGVVQKIDKHSGQLADALYNGVPIIISTLQKFPHVTKQLLKMAEERGDKGDNLLPRRRCAVIIDEAHSSQSGESATDLKEVLSAWEIREETAQYGAGDEECESLEEMYRSMAKRGKQANLSFFAFTATPKHKTLSVFGRKKGGKNGQAFHTYTMRQAIEEGFIMDVLHSYTTYATYYKLIQAGAQDPQVERKSAAKALARFMRLHPYNIAQKTEIMVEHFNTMTRHKIGGRAKAMVVTGSRLEAVRYKLSFDKYIREKKYTWIKTLVAFSGEVEDDRTYMKYTETGMNNGIRETELPEKFDSPEYQVLLVAEKYQTGFDQPLLHTMYVDKRLSGIQAVQTLSRLNRMHPLKEDTFVLDFVNDREEIREAFKQYYEGSEMGEEADPNTMYAIKAELDASGIYTREELDAFVSVYFKQKKRQSHADHKALNAAIDPAVERFSILKDKDEGQAELIRGKMAAFRNLYAFLSQVIPYQDSELEKIYTFLRYLLPKLPKRESGPRYSFDDDIRLEYYRIQKISEGSINLCEGDAKSLDGPIEVGSGKLHKEELLLSQLIDVVNERFGTDFTEADQLFFDQIIEAAVEEESLKEAAAVNPQEKFSLLFSGMLQALFIERMEQNENIFGKFMNEKEFQNVVSEWISEKVYNRLRGELSERNTGQVTE
ncbi:type I restriction endonuclease subunit R [Desulfobacter sp. UBA2225]|uniref:type I restriction endonuclease subunit R n=1 Tax=Desulfobacter sp. UBA2225 TaxID=1961413 RepID=UPI00257FEEB5|nr:type I restriction endonuclease [Desulfobacter sp. UBA2225]